MCNSTSRFNVSRRQFLQRGGLAAATAGTLLRSTIAGADPPDRPVASRESSPASMLLNGTAALCCPQLEPSSQLSFRLGLALTRTAAYPLDNLDFILMDLERPDGRSRHAHWCTGDLSGRTLEFLAVCEGLDGRSDARLPELFARIMKQRQPSGHISRYWYRTGRAPEFSPEAGSSRLFVGLLRYHDLTGDVDALDAATTMAEHLWTHRDWWRKNLPAVRRWITEPFARLYAVTKEPRWLELCAMIGERVGASGHSHGSLSALRGLQVAALVTGDLSWNERPELARQTIIEKRLEMPDGGIAESFPMSARNEGCSIADWLMLNLNAGLLLADDAAYDKAERIYWNALAFNQWITGCFGHRGLTPNGYSVDHLQEAWWCCGPNGGLAMAELARHVVTFRQGALSVNLLLPGRFEVPLPGGKAVQITITTDYPARAAATVTATGVPADVPVRLRVPTCIDSAEVEETRDGDAVRLVLRGRLGHRIEACEPGVMLTYGPLVLAPARWRPARVGASAVGEGIPEGYFPDAVPKGMPTLKVGGKTGADGFVELTDSLPEWSCWDEGPGARTWVEGAAANVPLKFPNDKEHTERFVPLCYHTSSLILSETPLVFRDVE